MGLKNLFGSSKHYSKKGFCPICQKTVKFKSDHPWFRDNLFCSGCESIPRERALALLLERHFPEWRELAIHESSPGGRGISPKMWTECKQYMPTQFFTKEKIGVVIDGCRNENLEHQTFKKNMFDLVITQDVMEHVNNPDAVFKEVARTLKPGGVYLFTVPTYKERVEGERRSRYMPDGTIEHYSDPEYHGNPVSDEGSLVTFHYGYDLPELIYQWSGMQVEMSRFHDHHHGIIGEFTEIYMARKT